MTSTPLRTHDFVWNAGPEVFGQQECQCGSLRDHTVHKVPQRNDEQRAHEARRVGER